ncbi:hypothetical protein Q7P37_003091 [Cladosporium fusiforme]
MTSPTIISDKSSGPIFFWREFEELCGFLSQWYDSTFEVDGVTYHSTEMWMMEVAKQMMQTTVPAEHQALGRKAKGFSRVKWDEHKSRIVEEGNWHKFTKCKGESELAKRLLETGDRELVEASPTDRIWGVGFAAANALDNREKWGDNRLGEAIMKVRERLRQESK